MTTDVSVRMADGWLELPQHLWIEEAALGGRFPARLDGRDFSLALPLGDVGGAHELLAPPIDSRVSQATVRPPKSWGSLSHDGTARVERLRIATQVPNPLGPRHVVEPAAIWTWLEHFLEWTTAWANDPERRDSVRVGYLRLVDNDGVSAVGHGSTTTVGAPVRGRQSTALSISRIALAALKASTAERLPLEHRLLLDAFASDDPRRAAIDAGTAVEVALTAGLVDHLENLNVPGDVVTALLSRTNGLDSLSRLYRRLVGPFRPAEVSGPVFEKFCGSRNDAAHRGIQPDAQQAIEVAVRLVDHLRPLPLEIGTSGGRGSTGNTVACRV